MPNKMSFDSTEPVDNGFTYAQLSAAFNLVAPKGNWKGRIDATVSSDSASVRLVETAVVFFTGSVPRITCGAHGQFRVQAAGYYIAIGA